MPTVAVVNSVVQPMLLGVPQGSVLGGPAARLLYILYTAELPLSLVARHGLNLHQCADDNRVTSAHQPGTARGVAECLVDIEAWLGSVVTYQVSETTRNLGVVIDSQLTLSAQVGWLPYVTYSGYYQLRQLRPLVRSMPSDAHHRHHHHAL